MSKPIDDTIAFLSKIYQDTEAKLQAHFEKVDLNKEKASALYTIALADECAKNAGLKASEYLPLLYVYLRARPDLEILKGGIIARVGDEPPANIKSAMSPKECALKHYELVKEHSVDLIAAKFAADEENAKKTGEPTRLKLEDICDEVVNKIGLKQYTVYFCVRHYIASERPDLKIGLGRYGGISKVVPVI